MASSLEVLRQRITSPGMTSSGQYPVPPSAQRRFLPSALAGSQVARQNKLLPAGFTGRHSWTAVSSPPSPLLSNRIQRLNLRLSAPTPGEEDLCRHWMENSANYCRRQNAQSSANQSKKLERPRTVQTPPGHPYKDLLPPRVKSAGKRKMPVRMTSPSHEYVTSSDSDRITSPSASHRSSGMRKLENRFSTARQPSLSSFGQGENPRNSPSSDITGNRHDNGDARSQPRPPSARPSEARWRNRARASYSPPNIRSGSAEKTRGSTGTDVRRWSLSETMLNHQSDSKDDDSAYSSSRDVTIHTDRLNVTPPYHPDTPPHSAPNFQSREHQCNASSPTRLSRVKGQVSKVMVSGQDGRPVFYYHNNQADNRQLSRHSQGRNHNLLPLRQAGNTQQRPKTQPAMGTQHSQNTFTRKQTRPQNRENPDEKRLQRAFPQGLPPANNKTNKNNLMEYHVGPNFYPMSLSDYDAMNKQRLSVVNGQTTIKPVNRYIDPEVGQRIIQWLTTVEQSPEVYYGFETDFFGN